jgi:hypothetical protein
MVTLEQQKHLKPLLTHALINFVEVLFNVFNHLKPGEKTVSANPSTDPLNSAVFSSEFTYQKLH